ncbi:MAG: N-acyl-D-amino-acid deacylase family protein [Bacillota bacterium]|jgi:N-acyl-D-amino-acid deacylase
MYDLIIKNGRLVDGTGNAWFYGDVAVQGERIAAVGRLDGARAKRVIDASGLVVAPGFIDAHSHSDSVLLVGPRAESKIRQGVTSEVIGQCGDSAAPRAVADAADGQNPSWGSMSEYLELLDQQGVAVNVIPLMGHGNLRRMVMGMAHRPPGESELAEMCRLAAEAMEQGAFGISSGLIYPPSSYADTQELIAISRTVAEYGGIYATHMRSEGARLLESVEEAITIGEQAGLPVHISHHKAMGEANWGRVRESLALIDARRAAGVDITLDQYPYIASATGLKSSIPQWAHADGVEAMRQRVVDPVIGARIRQEMAASQTRWDWTLVASCSREENKQFEGKNIEEISAIVGLDPVETTLRLLLSENFNVGMVRFAMCEEDVEYVMRHPLTMIGSDSSALAISGPLSRGKPHPRSYGTFARVLGHYVRERQVLTLEEAVRKMTGFPAARFRLWDRGLLRPGYYADITIFDAETIRDEATFVDPHQYASGVHYVLVNGQVTLDQGEQSECLAGKALRRPGSGRR